MGTASIFFHEFPTDRRPTQKKATPTPFGVKVGPLPLKIGLGDHGEKDRFSEIKGDKDNPRYSDSTSETLYTNSFFPVLLDFATLWRERIGGGNNTGAKSNSPEVGFLGPNASGALGR